MVEAYEKSVELSGVAAENLQARVRGTLLMGLSTQPGHLLLAKNPAGWAATLPLLEQASSLLLVEFVARQARGTPARFRSNFTTRCRPRRTASSAGEWSVIHRRPSRVRAR